MHLEKHSSECTGGKQQKWGAGTRIPTDDRVYASGVCCLSSSHPPATPTYFPAGGGWANVKYRWKMPETHFPAALDPPAAMGSSLIQRLGGLLGKMFLGEAG